MLVCSVISVYTDEGYCKVAETFVLNMTSENLSS